MTKVTLMPTLIILCLSLSACNENKKFDAEVNLAIKALKQRWTAIYKESSGIGIKTDGYLEIKNTRVISLKENTSSILGHNGIKYIIEFVIATDYFGTSPYYHIVGHENTVAIFDDGKAQVMPQNLMRTHHAITFSLDFSNFIQGIDDLHGAYNAVMKLPE